MTVSDDYSYPCAVQTAETCENEKNTEGKILSFTHPCRKVKYWQKNPFFPPLKVNLQMRHLKQYRHAQKEASTVLRAQNNSETFFSYEMVFLKNKFTYG